MVEKPTYPSFRLYKDKAGEWRWSHAAGNGNGNVIAASTEGCARKADALRGIEIITGAAGHDVWEDAGEG